MGKMEEIDKYRKDVVDLKNQLQSAENKEELEKSKEELEMILKNISEVFKDDDYEIEEKLKELKFFINRLIAISEEKIKKLIILDDIEKNYNFLNNLNAKFEENYLKRKKYNLEKKKKIEYLGAGIYLVFLAIMIPLFFIRDVGFEKRKIQESIKMVLVNKGDLEILKSTLSTFPTTKITIFDVLKGKREIYLENITIEKILIDIRNDNYKSENFDTQLNEKITLLLKENEKTSPIDKVTKNQAEYFLNIKGKLGDEDYNKIENDLVKIIEDMSYNNELINVYLAQADKSYLFSIIALIISAISVPVVIIQLVEATRNYFNTRKMKKEEKIKEKTNKKEE